MSIVSRKLNAYCSRELAADIMRRLVLSREGFYKTLSNLGVLPGLEMTLQSTVKVLARFSL
jgi:hypothetical protein